MGATAAPYTCCTFNRTLLAVTVLVDCLRSRAAKAVQHRYHSGFDQRQVLQNLVESMLDLGGKFFGPISSSSFLDCRNYQTDAAA